MHDHPLILDADPINHELEHPPLEGKGRAVQAIADTRTKRFNALDLLGAYTLIAEERGRAIDPRAATPRHHR